MTIRLMHHVNVDKGRFFIEAEYDSPAESVILDSEVEKYIHQKLGIIQSDITIQDQGRKSSGKFYSRIKGVFS